MNYIALCRYTIIHLPVFSSFVPKFSLLHYLEMEFSKIIHLGSINLRVSVFLFITLEDKLHGRVVSALSFMFKQSIFKYTLILKLL